MGGAGAGENWNQRLHVLDVTHPDAAEHLEGVFACFAALGVDYHKLDFMYAGALPGRRREDIAPLAAYREGLRIIRRGAGKDAILLGCGAPLLPSIGLVDAIEDRPRRARRAESRGRRYARVDRESATGNTGAGVDERAALGERSRLPGHSTRGPGA